MEGSRGKQGIAGRGHNVMGQSCGSGFRCACGRSDEDKE